jgi:threonylcarbamoyladenosine tRNA methylthiotransferase MtaB
MTDNSIFNNKKVAYHTLGCKLNFAETSAIGKQLSNEGFVKVKPGEQADVCIINTCSVTDTADHKCRQAINRLNRLHPNAIMVVTGCYAQLKPDEIASIAGVDLVL